VALAFVSPLLHAQTPPKRLSDWLLEQEISPNAYPLGLSWQVPAEVAAQNTLRLQISKSLSGLDSEVKAKPEAMGRLRDWLNTLPVTGRVPVAMPDASWLQVNPARDPILRPGHSVVLPQRPSTVTVITSQGERCMVTHVAGHEARDYLEACDPAGAARADWVWMAQPDGRVQRYGVAMWNREAQDEPAPGAWIWGPRRDGGWPEPFSQRLVTFLATQGPAPDPVRGVVGCDANVGEGVRGGEADGFRLSGLKCNASEAPPHPSPLPQGEREPAAMGERGPVSLPPGAPATRSRGLQVSSSNWGGVGLLQTPTARMRSAGHLASHFSLTQPYLHGNVFAQPLDWLEAGFRYTDVSNRLYGPAALSGSQSYKDKGIDVKIRLWPESAYVPQIAAGLRDIAGTGLFSGEYLVASKRTGDFDWSLGMGWGYVGGRGNLRNPLGVLSSAFDTRKVDVGTGGQFALTSYFRGPAALFGGVQYQTPWDRLSVKLEYDGNDYQHEPQANNQKQSSPFNFGLVYRVGSAADVTLGVERGNTFTVGLTLHGQLDGLSTPKVSDPPRVAVAATRPQKAPDWTSTADEIKRQSDWQVRSIEQHGNELRVTIDDAEAVYWRERVDRIAAVLHRDAPQPVDRFTLAYRERGMEVAEHVVDRDAWVAKQTQTLPPSEQRETVIARKPEPTAPGTVLYENTLPKFESGLGFGYGQTLGGPDGFVLYQIYAQERAKFRIRDDTWLQGSLRLRLSDNYDKFKYTAPSSLPRVRTFLREYLTTSTVTMPNLQLVHVGKLTGNQYYSVYGGYLEEMFAGVGGEWLYRPYASKLAFGVDVNQVRQRSFQQDFSFDDAGTQTNYRVTTGHATLYWDTGWNGVDVGLSAGRYLAGDLGVTLGVSRTFKNGVSVGAFGTKTDVSAAAFGEGSFDKGIFVNIPFDAIFTRTTNTVGSFVWKPLTRDGGAKLGRGVSLYGLTGPRDDRTLMFAPAPAPNESTIPADRREAWVPTIPESEPYTRVTPKPMTEQWEPGSSQEHRLIEALYRQQFRNIGVNYDRSYRLTIALSNDRIQPISRAVGRAARTALRLAPLDAREIHITFSQRTTPAVTYDFFDLPRLERYFNGTLKEADLADYVAIEYLNPAAREQYPLARLNDLETDGEPRVLAALVPDTLSPQRVWDDVSGAARTAVDANWLEAGAYGAGIVLASSVLDSRTAQFAQDHAANRWLKGGIRLGNAVPWLGLGGAALAAFDGSDPRRSRTGYAAVEAGGAALLAVAGLKYAVGRARPDQNTGSHDFKPFSSSLNPLSTSNSYDSFPSGHTIVAWAVATPFALEYNAPWLYGVAGLTNLARAGSRQHWVSDTVAGSLLGYGIGRIFWESSRAPGRSRPNVMVTPSGVKLSWDIY
jgi:membrane-associated phospholipid phosphatase